MRRHAVPARHRAAHRPVRADDARLGAARRHRRAAAACSRCSPGGCPTAAATASSPAPAGCSRRSRDFRFDDDDARVPARRAASSTTRRADYLADYRFSGDVDGYPEGELYFPCSPDPHRDAARFAEAVVLETLVLSILNHDSAIASAAARMVAAAGGRPIIEMGSRRTHEQAAVAAARAAYLAGFAVDVQPRRRPRATASRRPAPPRTRSRCCTTTSGPPSPPRSTRSAPAPRCWSTPTTSRRGIEHRRRGRRAASSARSASTPATSACWPGRPARSSTPSAPPAPGSCVTGDLDEYAIAALRRRAGRRLRRRHRGGHRLGRPDRGHGLQAGRGATGGPVAKRSEHKESRGGRKTARAAAQADAARRSRRSCIAGAVATRAGDDRLLQRSR